MLAPEFAEVFWMDFVVPPTWGARERTLWPHFYGLVAPRPRPTLARLARWQREQLALTRLAWQAPPPVLQAARTVATAAAARLAVDPVATSAVTLVWGVDPWHVAETLGLTRDIERARTLRRFLALTKRCVLESTPRALHV